MHDRTSAQPRCRRGIIQFFRRSRKSNDIGTAPGRRPFRSTSGDLAGRASALIIGFVAGLRLRESSESPDQSLNGCRSSDRDAILVPIRSFWSPERCLMYDDFAAFSQRISRPS